MQTVAPPRRRRWLLLALQVALFAVVVWGVWRSLAPELARVQPGEFLRYRPAALPLIASFLLLCAVYLGHALLWRSILADVGAVRAPLRTTIQVYFVASLGRYIPGKLWQLAGLAVLAQRAGLPPGSAAGAAVLGQLGFLSTGMLLLALLLPEWAGWWPALAAGVMIAAGAIGLWLLVATRLGHRVRAAILGRAGERGRGRLESAFAFADRVQVRSALGWALGYALTWVCLGAAFALFVIAFVPAAAAPAAIRFHAGTVAASYLYGYMIFLVPAGAGVREVAMAGLLAQHGAVPAAAAVVIAVGSRVWFTAAELVPLALVPFLPRVENRMRPD